MADRRLVVTRKGTDAQAELQANEQGSLYVILDPSGNPIPVELDGPVEAVVAANKDTDRYGIQALSEDATYKYFWFEADNADYYIMRKHKTNKTFSYTKGTGGYAAVYVNSTSGPSGSPTWANRGATF